MEAIILENTSRKYSVNNNNNSNLNLKERTKREVEMGMGELEKEKEKEKESGVEELIGAFDEVIKELLVLLRDTFLRFRMSEHFAQVTRILGDEFV